MISVNVFEIEQLRRNLLELNSVGASCLKKLFSYYKYFDLILSSKNNSIIEAYLHEFIEDYCKTICKIDLFGFNPDFIEKLLKQIETLKNNKQLIAYSEIFQRCEEKLSSSYEIITSILRGESTSQHLSANTYFPLIDKEAKENIFVVIESVTIKISKGDKENKFILVPSEKDIEEKLSAQIRTSWFTALSETKRFVRKTFPFHEVLIHFNKAEGFYEGNSLGLALTLSFIEELLKFYNPTYSITIKESTAFTGAIDENGKVSNTGSEIISIKTSGVFFSPIQTFIIPKEDEDEAKKKLSQLRETYPNRNLKLIAVEELNDVLNRRDIVEIKKVSPVVRTGRFAKQNWGSAIVSIILTALLAFLFVLDFDENPVAVKADGSFLHILNKNGKVLWSKNFPFNTKFDHRLLYLNVKIVDINDDGLNEILLVGEKKYAHLSMESSDTLRCYDSYGNIIWKYSFNDQVYSQREALNKEYGIKIIDTLYFENKKSLYLSSSNGPSFSSAIYRIDLSNGKRLPGTLWCSGHVTSAMIKDINNDGKKDLLCLGYENGYEDAVLFGCELDTLTKVRPTTEEYLIKNYLISDVLAYIRFAKVDYDIFYGNRTPSVNPGILGYEIQNNKYSFSTNEFHNERTATIGYEISNDFKEVNIVIDSGFRVRRDTLVAHGKLNPPYTDTKEYQELIKNQILFWNGKEFVPIKKL